MNKMNMENMKTAVTPSGSNIADFEAKLKAIQEKNQIQTKGKFNHDELMQALYYMWDAFDRSNIMFFLIGKTAESCYKNLPLVGDKVEIGIRYLERHSGAWRIFKEFAKVLNEKDNIIHFESQGVPIECKVFEDDIYFTQPSPQYWQYESFNIPNPYLDYVEKYEKPTKEKVDTINK